MITRKRIYVAGPITLGDKINNLRLAVVAGQKLLDAGFAPFVPHLSIFWEYLYPNNDWLAMDLPWVACADAVLRLPGESKGADQEVTFAISKGIPVFYDVESLILKF